MDFYYLQDVTGISPITFFSTILVLLLSILYYQLKNKDLPPGPIGIPVLGYWPYLREDDLHLQLTEIGKKYGDIYSFTAAGTLFIHLGSIKAIKEVNVVKADCFAERFNYYSILNEFFAKGVVAVNGEKWKTLRKFFVQSFREHGLTSVKEYMTGPIYDSVNASVDVLKATNGTPINIISVLNDSSSGILRRMVFNDVEIKDEELKGMLECYQNMLPTIVGKNLLLMGNIAKYFIFPRSEGFQHSLENVKKMHEYLRIVIKRHEATFNEDDVRDIIDSYIKERNERNKKGDPSAEYFSEDALVSSLVQIVGDGVLGITIFIAYYIHELLEHPEEQEKIYEELENVIGPDRQITLEDRNKLSYTNAFIQEVMRTTDFFPLFPVLHCTKETTLFGYKIPKGAVTVANFWSAHHDSNVFNEPDEFKPSRYRTEPGTPKTEAPIAFGVGKRSCAGESFTMMQVFLFFTTLIKNFRLERPAGNVKKNFFDGIMEVCAYPRKQTTA